MRRSDARVYLRTCVRVVGVIGKGCLFKLELKMTQLNEEVAISLPAPLKIALEEDCFRILRRGKVG